jgi:ankyrin repeat protein
VIAANKGAIQTCKILMSYGACLDSAQQLKVILEHALSHQYDDILEFFIQSPEDFSVIDPSLRSHAAEYLIQKSLEKYWPHLIQYSIESAKIENNNPLFGDMLDFAIEQADADLLHMLIQKLGLGFVFTNVLQHTDSMSAQLNDDNPVIQIVEQKIQPLLLSADPQKIQLLARLKHRFSNHY